MTLEGDKTTIDERTSRAKVCDSVSIAMTASTAAPPGEPCPNEGLMRFESSRPDQTRTRVSSG
ncbi:hypothetical protein CFB84_08040 [Burkholderia aenigmatica]|uniref:Uncharacterized protein n=1 Tax=Burkholderia aenigmatica TaxID=2015348 RepID=A0A228J2S0_9BURK|nr:hypothetical protein CFB84_08040 [Burkholderia aenigmatica]